MKRYIFGLLWLGVASSVFAQTPAPADSSGTTPDSLAAPAVAPPASEPVTQPAATPPPPVTTTPVQTETTPPPSDIRTTETYAKDNTPSKWYYGATVGFSFWGDVRRISIQPMLARKLTPRLSIGGEVEYEHLKVTSGPTDQEYDNYGASVFSNFKLTPRFYAHAEYDLISYDFVAGRDVVPFLYVGGGVVQAAGRASLYAEVLVDVLNHSDSPYNDYEPQVSVGVSVGF